MNLVYNFFYSVLYSLWLDWHFLFGTFPETYFEKYRFILYKYFHIIKHHLLHILLNLKSARVRLGNQAVYFGSNLGLSVFQSMIVTLNKHIFPLLRDFKKPIIVDAGAHVGFFSLPLAAHFTKPRIYAFEPVSITYDLLKKNVRDYHNITAVPLGLFDKKKRMKIFYNQRLLIYSSLFKERFAWDQKPRHEIVNLTTLDSFCKDNDIRKIHLLKIDTEGAEEKVLKGAKNILPCIQYIFLECSLDHIDHSTFTSLMSCLKGNSYNFQLVTITSTIGHEGHLLLINMLLKNISYKA